MTPVAQAVGAAIQELADDDDRKTSERRAPTFGSGALAFLAHHMPLSYLTCLKLHTQCGEVSQLCARTLTVAHSIAAAIPAAKTAAAAAPRGSSGTGGALDLRRLPAVLRSRLEPGVDAAVAAAVGVHARQVTAPTFTREHAFLGQLEQVRALGAAMAWLACLADSLTTVGMVLITLRDAFTAVADGSADAWDAALLSLADTFERNSGSTERLAGARGGATAEGRRLTGARCGAKKTKRGKKGKKSAGCGGVAADTFTRVLLAVTELRERVRRVYKHLATDVRDRRSQLLTGVRDAFSHMLDLPARELAGRSLFPASPESALFAAVACDHLLNSLAAGQTAGREGARIHLAGGAAHLLLATQALLAAPRHGAAAERMKGLAAFPARAPLAVARDASAAVGAAVGAAAAAIEASAGQHAEAALDHLCAAARTLLADRTAPKSHEDERLGGLPGARRGEDEGPDGLPVVKDGEEEEEAGEVDAGAGASAAAADALPTLAHLVAQLAACAEALSPRSCADIVALRECCADVLAGPGGAPPPARLPPTATTNAADAPRPTHCIWAHAAAPRAYVRGLTRRRVERLARLHAAAAAAAARVPCAQCGREAERGSRLLFPHPRFNRLQHWVHVRAAAASGPGVAQAPGLLVVGAPSELGVWPLLINQRGAARTAAAGGLPLCDGCVQQADDAGLAHRARYRVCGIGASSILSAATGGAPGRGLGEPAPGRGLGESAMGSATAAFGTAVCACLACRGHGALSALSAAARAVAAPALFSVVVRRPRGPSAPVVVGIAGEVDLRAAEADSTGVTDCRLQPGELGVVTRQLEEGGVMVLRFAPPSANSKQGGGRAPDKEGDLCLSIGDLAAAGDEWPPARQDSSSSSSSSSPTPLPDGAHAFDQAKIPRSAALWPSDAFLVSAHEAGTRLQVVGALRLRAGQRLVAHAGLTDDPLQLHHHFCTLRVTMPAAAASRPTPSPESSVRAALPAAEPPVRALPAAKLSARVALPSSSAASSAAQECLVAKRVEPLQALANCLRAQGRVSSSGGGGSGGSLRPWIAFLHCGEDERADGLPGGDDGLSGSAAPICVPGSAAPICASVGEPRPPSAEQEAEAVLRKRLRAQVDAWADAARSYAHTGFVCAQRAGLGRLLQQQQQRWLLTPPPPPLTSIRDRRAYKAVLRDVHERFAVLPWYVLRIKIYGEGSPALLTYLVVLGERAPVDVVRAVAADPVRALDVPRTEWARWLARNAAHAARVADIVVADEALEVAAHAHMWRDAAALAALASHAACIALHRRFDREASPDRKAQPSAGQERFRAALASRLRSSPPKAVAPQK